MRDTPPHVLVAYASKRGGTAGIAAAIAEVLLNEGIAVELASASQVDSVAEYDAVIIGGALYMARWHRDARRFVRRHAGALRARPVWMFSSGPLDNSASEREIPAPGGVAALRKLIGARGHITFGGRLAADAKGFPAAAMAKTRSGDWREWDEIRAWAKQLAPQLHAEASRPTEIVPTPPPAPTSTRAHRWLLAALCWFVSITAIAGGAALVMRPDGSLLDAPLSLLRYSPFASFLIPGVLLFGVVGVGSAIAAVFVTGNSKLAAPTAFFAGAALLVWITVEMALLRSVHWLQIGYLLAATLILIEAWKVFALRWRHDSRAAGHATGQLS